MNLKTNLIRNLWGLGIRDRALSTKVAATLSINDPIEEETMPRYCPRRYYPVHIGQTFDNRFLIIAKLGYGTSSTVWLARDIQNKCRRSYDSICLLLLLISKQDGHGEQTFS